MPKSALGKICGLDDLNGKLRVEDFGFGVRVQVSGFISGSGVSSRLVFNFTADNV